VISLSLFNFIKTILNIQDNNISFPEEDYCQIIQKGNYVIKVFKGFLKSNYCYCPHCNSKNIVKNGSRERNIKFIPFQNYNVELNLSIQRHICKDCKKTFSPSTTIVKDSSNISNNFKYTIAQELQENISLTFIAKKYNLSISFVEDRRLNSLTEYFSRFSLEARNNVKYICMDIYSPYISLVKSIFPESEIVLDKFHIVNLVSRAFNQTRISIMNSLKDD